MLLQFLRGRKYRMNEVFQTYERCFLAKKRYTKFFDSNIEDSMKMFYTGYCYPLIERDSNGRRIVLVQPKWNPGEFSIYDAIRLLCYVTTVLLEEEETQIAGMIFIFDYAKMTLGHLMTPIELIEFLDFVNKCTAARQKGNIIMNLPPYAQLFIKIGKSMMSDKLQKRLFVLKNQSELQNHVSLELLPREYGGVRPEAEMMEEFLKLRQKHHENVHKFYSFEVDWSKASAELLKLYSNDESVGSFRKLEID